jgi:peptide deformylase
MDKQLHYLHKPIQTIITDRYKHVYTPFSSSASNVPRTLNSIFSRSARISHLLRWFGDPVLRERAETIHAEDILTGQAQNIADQMTNVLMSIRRTLGIGRAIAAPQIGLSKRIIGIIGGFDNPSEVAIFVNPRITWESNQKSLYKEICLSGLPLAANVIRPLQIEVEYQDLTGKITKLKPTPILSRILQHEIDHLEGVLFIDRAEPLSMMYITDFEEYKRTTPLITLGDKGRSRYSGRRVSSRPDRASRVAPHRPNKSMKRTRLLDL